MAYTYLENGWRPQNDLVGAASGQVLLEIQRFSVLKPDQMIDNGSPNY
jgi:hypothetical protein